MLRTVTSSDVTLIRQVIDLATTQRRTLGFLPDAAYLDRAARQTLLARMDATNRQVRAFALYDVVGLQIHLRQLCVDPDFRNQGFARELVDGLFRMHPTAHGVALWCREDYPAHHMWRRLGFVPRAERPGRSSDGSTLVLWVRQALNAYEGTLLGLLHDHGRLRVGLDNNVLYDLHEPERGALDSQGLLADWLVAEISLCVTSQVFVEIFQDQDPTRRTARLAWAHSYEEPPCDQERLRQVARKLESEAPSQSSSDEGDILHVAAASASGLRWLVTHDQALLTRLKDAALAHAQVALVTPAELVGRQLESLSPGRYQPRELFGLRYEERPILASEIDQLSAEFGDARPGGSPRILRTALQEAIANPGAWITGVVLFESRPVAIVVRRHVESEERVRVFRLARDHGHTLARQLLARIKSLAAINGQSIVIIEDKVAGQTFPDALIAEHFLPLAEGWSAPCRRIIGTGAQLADLLKEDRLAPQHHESAELLRLGPSLHVVQQAQLEQVFWPMKCLDGPLPTYLIPIKPWWSDDLLGTTSAQMALWRRPEGLGLSREHVYFKSPLGPLPTAPARLLWYRSGRDAGIVACSRLVDTVVDGPAELHHRYGHLGVLDTSQIQTVAREGRVLAMRFADTEVLDRRIPLGALRQLSAAHCHSLVLQSPTRIPERVFEAIYREAFDVH